jgi:hypothetical protein
MVTLFEPAIIAIQNAIKNQMDTAFASITVSGQYRLDPFLGHTAPLKAVLLVGGFGASDWLFSELQNYLQGRGVRLTRPDGHLYVSASGLRQCVK